MDFDFSAIMLLAVVVTGIIWAVDIAMLKPKRIAAGAALQGEGNSQAVVEQAYKEPVLVEYARSFFPVILAVLILRSFLIEPFRIPSGSMMPTLLSGDFILVNKFDYGIRLPVVNAKVIELGSPERGDVVVFRYPEDPKIDYIKRVVGLPGDTITYYGKQVYINGEPAKQERIGGYFHAGEGKHMNNADQRREQLGDVEHEILVSANRRGFDGEYVVPEGHYFVMGDNRDHSSDSRFWGFVPDENLVGKAFMIWMNWDGVQSRVSFERIGNMID